MFLARRTKTIHFVRHAEGIHNEANKAYGDDTPCTYSTEGSWRYKDARLTDKGIQQCLDGRTNLMLRQVKPELVVVSPFTRTLQTAHLMFSSQNIPFIVHDLARERWGKYTCDKRRARSDIVEEMSRLYTSTHDSIDYYSFGFEEEEDRKWENEREASASVTGRGIALMEWLASRPEREIAVVTHASFLRHLFGAFGGSIELSDQKALHRKSGNCELRSITLALHRGFYPVGEWQGEDFKPSHHSFRRGKWATPQSVLFEKHAHLRANL
jgi:broad specificity phosphatase PhoE